MISHGIPLRFTEPGYIAHVRELTGREEFQVLGTNTSNALNLLSALIEDATPFEAADLVASDRDRLLAAVYESAFGDRIESTLTCARCSQPFDLDFSLRKVIETVDEKSTTAELKALGDGNFETSEGKRFRLPTGRDEVALAGLRSDVVQMLLLQRCAATSDWSAASEAFEDFLEEVAPLLDLELLAPCAECHHVHNVQFDIQTYVLGAIIAERRRLLSEINRLARTYSWSLKEILSLSRSDRRQFVELIENEYVT